MSLQGLISGSECAASSNPLSQVLKHSEGDRSLQKDKVAGSSARLHRLPGTSVANEHELALARQFFDGNAGAGATFALPQHFPPAEVLRMEEMNRRGIGLNEAWGADHQDSRVLSLNGSWANEFGNTTQISPASSSVQHSAISQSELQRRPPYLSSGLLSNVAPMGMYGGMHMGPNLYQENYWATLDQVKGKGKSRDVDFEAAFAQVAASLPPSQTETQKIVEVDNEVASIAETLENATLEEHPSTQENLAQWEAEFNQMMNTQREESDDDYGALMQQAWENGIGDYREDGLAEPQKFDNEGLPILGEYVFELDNKYLGPSTATRSPLSEAKALLEQNGSLTEAALLLEAAIQQGELGEGGYEAWVLLGETKNMDEREDAGMRALAEGVKRADAAGTPGPGMLSLAISYTNESFEKAAHITLLRWLRARFPSHPIPEDTLKAMPTNASWDTHSRVTDAFISLARHQHSEGYMDPDVQIGLGILFYSNGEYDRAKDCFETALSVRPKDYVLWNRLGSSLSNGSKPEEALGAYREALQLRPSYTRAIYNVGVACLNMGAHREGAEHFLSALAMQESIGGESSQQLWHTLRRAFLLMDRPDLVDLTNTDPRTNLEEFRKMGFDF